MSRTYRRKNGWDYPTYDYLYNENIGCFQEVTLDKSSPEFKKQKSKYHRDKKTYGTCVPHWYINLFCERGMRRKTKKELNKWIKNPDNIEPMIPIFIRNAGWNYW